MIGAAGGTRWKRSSRSSGERSEVKGCGGFYQGYWAAFFMNLASATIRFSLYEEIYRRVPASGYVPAATTAAVVTWPNRFVFVVPRTIRTTEFRLHTMPKSVTLVFCLMTHSLGRAHLEERSYVKLGGIIAADTFFATCCHSPGVPLKVNRFPRDHLFLDVFSGSLFQLRSY